MNPDEYRKLADVEDRMWYFRALHAQMERELRGALGGGTAAVLDGGCGTGGLIGRLAPRNPGWRWTGVDLSDIACRLARQRLADRTVHAVGDTVASRRTVTRSDGMDGPSIAIEQASITALPFADAAFDAVVSADVLCQLDDDAAALREFFRVMRRGGIAVINVPAYNWMWSYHDVAVQSRRRYSRRELREKLTTAGFSPVRVTYRVMLPFPLAVVRRKLLPAPRGGSDVQVYPAPIEAAFNAAMAIERGCLQLFGCLPFGTSVFAIARKP